MLEVCAKFGVAGSGAERRPQDIRKKFKVKIVSYILILVLPLSLWLKRMSVAETGLEDKRTKSGWGQLYNQDQDKECPF